MKNNDGIKRTSIDRLKLLSGTSYRSGDIVITPLMSLKNLNDITTLIQGVTIGVTVSGTTRLRINGKPYELRPNTLFIFNENTVIEQVKASIRSSGYMLTYSRSYLNRIHVDTQDVISIYHGFMGEPCITVDPDEASYINDLSKLMRATLAGDATTANRDRVLAALFAAMFHYVMGIIPKHTFVGQADVSNRTDELFNRFVVLLREHCRTQRSVEFYAAQMGITPKYLSLILKKKSGRNASKLPMVAGYTPGRTATVSTTVYQLWRTGQDALALRWVLVNLGISAAVLLAVNLLERKEGRSWP